MNTRVSAILVATVIGACRLAMTFTFMGLLAMPAAAQVFNPGPSDSALFDTVIDLPPAPNIGSGQSIGGDGFTTQVNLDDDGFINSSFDVLGGGELNVRGGRINTSMNVRSGGEFNLSGGLIGFTGQAFDGSHVTMTGGLIDQNFEVRAGAVMLLRGGAVSRRFRARAESDLEIFGQDFRLNGNLIAAPDLAEVSLADDDVLTGVLEDGSTFIFSPQADDVILDVQLNQSTLPGPADTTPIVVDTANPVRPSGVRAGQTFTLRDGGELPINFEAVDATVNIEGGLMGNHSGFARSTVNVSGGQVDAFSNAYAGTTINITGGEWGSFSDAHSGSIVNVIGGTLGSTFEAQVGSTININLGVVDNSFSARAGSTVDIAGGAIGPNFNIDAGSDAELFGGEFRLNGEEFTGSTLTLGDDDVFTATLADGSTTIFAGNRSDDIVGLKVVPVFLPALDTTPQFINTADHGRPSGLRAGQTLTVQAGGVLGKFFEMVDGSTLNIEGGILGEDAAVVRGTINLRSGAIRRALIGGDGSVVNVSGGSTGNQWEAQSGSEFNFSGGVMGTEFTALAGSVVNVSGGTFEEFVVEGGEVNITGGDLGPDFEANSGSVVNISGGTFGDSIRFDSGSEVNLLGFGFLIDGLPAVPIFQGENFVNQAQDAVLSGTFADGTPFSFDFSEDDFLSSAATLTLTVTTNIPGDFNGDGGVDGSDFLVWQRTNRSASELALWKVNYGTTPGAFSVSIAVPEPSTLMLLVSMAFFTVSTNRKVRR